MLRLRRRRRPRYGRHGTYRGAEHRRENEERAEVNVPPHLLSLWRRTRRQFKGAPHQRYEQFMQYVHDHGEREAMGALQEDADEKLEQAIRHREERHNRFSEAGRTLAEKRWSSVVPF